MIRRGITTGTSDDEAGPDLDLFRPYAERNAADRAGEIPATADRPRLANGGQPRGLSANGLVRTTGWLQIGRHQVSSGLVAAVVGLLAGIAAAAPVVRTAPVGAGVVIVSMLVVYGVWRLSLWLVPASAARNIAVVSAGSLCPDSWVRVYGSIGPVAQVEVCRMARDGALATTHPDGAIEVGLRGGATVSWPCQHQVHLVELLDSDTAG